LAEDFACGELCAALVAASLPSLRGFMKRKHEHRVRMKQCTRRREEKAQLEKLEEDSSISDQSL
jgi:hypothetical protein